MAMVKNIAVGIDFSKYSAHTLRFAAVLAESLGAILTVINVIHQRDVDAVKFIQNTTEMMKVDDYIAQRKEDRQKQIEKLMETAQCSALPYEVVIRVGTPWEEVLEAVREAGSDMLVIGTKGRTGSGRNLFGSNSDKIYRHCPVSVLSARGDEHAELVCKLRGA